MTKVFGSLGFFLVLLVICNLSNCVTTELDEKQLQYNIDSQHAHIGTLSVIYKLREKRQVTDLKNRQESPTTGSLSLKQDQLQNKNVYRTTDDSGYYNITRYVSKLEADYIWDTFKNITPNSMLSESNRRATTIELTFDFPYYGHPIRIITVATGGFLYTGEFVHSWLAATQYIAPLMANFDASLGNDSYVRFNDNGTALTVFWDNVYLQNKQHIQKFSFSTTLHQNGDIVFVYFSVPINIISIEDNKHHPVKVGLSDAYFIDKVIYFVRRKTISEYHRVNFASTDITNSTIIYLKALPTCLQYSDCGSCINHKTSFDCTWCPGLNRCSTGTDRRKQEWLQKGCDRKKITTFEECPLIVQKDNNANQINTAETALSTSNKNNTDNHDNPTQCECNVNPNPTSLPNIFEH